MIAARFLTAGRDDLFAVTRRLMGAVCAAALPPDPAAPVLVGVNGSLQSGKKIIADAAVETLFDPGTAVMEGKAGYDEYWRGTRGGAAYGVDYIDMAYPFRADYSAAFAARRRAVRGCVNDMTVKFDDFCAARVLPGISFVQNPGAFNERCGITLYIENRALAQPVGYKVPRLHLAPDGLKAVFAELSGREPWARLVEIEIRDRRLLASVSFNDEFLAFAPYCRVPERTETGAKQWHRRLQQMVFIDREIEPRGIRSGVNIFGRGGFPMATAP